MKSSLLAFGFLLGLAPLAQAKERCKLPLGEKITIGCTYNKCDFPTRFRLRAAAARLGYRVKFINLSSLHQQQKDVSEILNSVDSVVIPGGADIHPKFYLKDVTPELREYTNQNLHLVNFSEEGRKRDLFEYTLVKMYQDSQTTTQPMLGICRGMQMMSVAKGIPLYLDIKTELGIPNRIWKLDRIFITEDASLMDSLYGDRRFSGFQLHHQGIRVDYYQKHQNEFKNVSVSSYSNDGLVAESIEYTNQPALGVQYHPEKSVPETAYPIFKWFLTKACEHKNSSKDIR